MATKTIIIRKSFIGYVTRIFWGALAVSLMVVVLWLASVQFGPLPPTLMLIVALYLAVVAVVTIASIYLYALSSLELTDSGITVNNWITLFADREAEMSWYRVQSVESRQGGIVGELVGYGTLTIQQAGTEQPIVLTYVPRADYWATYIQQRANVTPTPTPYPLRISEDDEPRAGEVPDEAMIMHTLACMNYADEDMETGELIELVELVRSSVEALPRDSVPWRDAKRTYLKLWQEIDHRLGNWDITFDLTYPALPGLARHLR